MAIEVVETTIGFSIGGNFGAVVLHWRTDVTGGESAFQTAKDVVDALEGGGPGAFPFYETLQGILAEDTFISSTRARRVTSGGGATYQKAYATGTWSGTFSGNSDAAQVAGTMLKFTSGPATRQGRTFWPGVSEEATDVGRFTEDYEVAMLALRTSFLAGVESTYLWLPVLRYGSPVAYQQIIACELSATPGTIRRRLVPI